MDDCFRNQWLKYNPPTDSKPQRYGTIQEITINDEADKEQNKIKMQVAIYYKNQH